MTDIKELAQGLSRSHWHNQSWTQHSGLGGYTCSGVWSSSILESHPICFSSKKSQSSLSPVISSRILLPCAISSLLIINVFSNKKSKYLTLFVCAASWCFHSGWWFSCSKVFTSNLELQKIRVQQGFDVFVVEVLSDWLSPILNTGGAGESGSKWPETALHGLHSYMCDYWICACMYSAGVVFLMHFQLPVHLLKWNVTKPLYFTLTKRKLTWAYCEFGVVLLTKEMLLVGQE